MPASNQHSELVEFIDSCERAGEHYGFGSDEFFASARVSVQNLIEQLQTAQNILREERRWREETQEQIETYEARLNNLSRVHAGTLEQLETQREALQLAWDWLRWFDSEGELHEPAAPVADVGLALASFPASEPK